MTWVLIFSLPSEKVSWQFEKRGVLNCSMHVGPRVRSATMIKVALKCLWTDAASDAAVVWLRSFNRRISVVLLVVRLVVLSERCVAPFWNVCWFIGGVGGLTRCPRVMKKKGGKNWPNHNKSVVLDRTLPKWPKSVGHLAAIPQTKTTLHFIFVPRLNLQLSPPSSLRLSCCPLTKLRSGSSPSHHPPCNSTPPTPPTHPPHPQHSSVGRPEFPRAALGLRWISRNPD